MNPEETRSAPEAIELPAPTPWPLVTGFGISLVFAGLITHVIVAVVGMVLVLCGAVGWWRDVLPHERHERIVVRPPAERPVPIVPAPGRVEHLVVGKGHRVHLPVEIHPYSAGLWGGLIGGVAMAAVAETYGLIAFGSLWYPVNLLAAALMPSLARASLEQLAAFSGVALTVAAFIHMVVSLSVGLLYAVLLPMFPRKGAAVWGGVVAPLLWTGLLWALLGVINPALNDRIQWRWFIASQIAFGLTTGFVVARSRWVETMQTWPLAARAGLEAPGVVAGRKDSQ
jgi:hypothetical protein